MNDNITEDPQRNLSSVLTNELDLSLIEQRIWTTISGCGFPVFKIYTDVASELLIAGVIRRSECVSRTLDINVSGK